MGDLPALKAVIGASELFPSDILEDIMSNYFSNDKNKDIWLINTVVNKPIAISFYAPEKMTGGTLNLYLTAVYADYQGQGTGSFFN